MWPANGHVPIEDGSVNMTPEQDSNQSGENVMAGFDSEDDNMEIVEEQSYSNFGIYNANKLSSPLAQKLDLTASPNRCEDSTKQKIERLAQLFKELSQAEQREVFTRLLEETSMTNIRHLRHLIEPHFQRDFLSFLPVEIGMKIIAKLNGIDKIKLSSVSKNWRLISEHHSIWKNTYDEELFNLPDPTNRISGAWQQATKCNGPNISDYWSNYQSNKKGSIYARAPEKAKYMRMERISQNWKENPIRASCILRGHEDHVITCMQIHDDLLVTGSDDNTLKVWSIDKGALKFSLTGHTGGVWTSQISSCGQYIISGSTDRTVKVWSTIDGSLKHTLQGHTSTVRCMAMWNNLLVTGSRDTTLRIWNINEGRCLLILLGHQAAVRCVQFDGKLVVSGGYDFTVKIWSASSGRCLKTLAGHTNRVYSLLFDRDRSIVASGSLDTTIRVWDFQKRDGEECIALLQGHTSLTSGMQLKGNILVSCNADSHVRVWDIRDGSCVFYLTGHRSAITSLQFFGNHIIATSSDDGTVKLWDIKKGSFLRDLVSLESGGSGGCIWRLCATPTLLACAVGSRNSTEETKVILLNFDSVYP